ncbi:hypothetical protein GLW03_04630 [Halobacillus halophilus]|uniref:hypothetical protein n=1 Tax=Halobacillus halophilus TaxID=1570 RepID=UPI00136BE414|nr:hypothetical protein [Halobacillus halophilus]MYL29096.1 hypothetical protein [Halobacillus halophilus]
MKKLLSVFTMFVLLLGMVSPAYADESTGVEEPQVSTQLSEDEKSIIQDELNNFDVEEYASNIDELSEKNREIANEALRNFDVDSEEIFANISKQGEMVVIVKAETENTTVSVTDDSVEVIKHVNKDDFKINGEDHHIEVTVSEGEVSSKGLKSTVSPEGGVSTQAADGYIETDYRSGPWDFLYSDWVNINTERNIATYSAGAIGGTIGAAIAGSASYGFLAGAGWSAGVGIAYTFAAADEYPTNVGKVYLAAYENSPYPTADRKIFTNAYAVYQGENVYLGTDNTYYARCLGCGGV